MWRAYLIVALAFTCAAFAAGWRKEMIAKGVAQEQARVADSVLVTVQQEKRRIDSVLVPVIKYLPTYIARVDSLRDTVLKNITDTVLVKEYIVQERETTSRCTLLLNACTASQENHAREIAAYEAKLRALPVGETRSEKVVSRAAWLLLGGALGYIGGRY